MNIDQQYGDPTSQMLQRYLDGELDRGMEPSLFRAVAEDAELRAELRDYLTIRSVLHRDNAGIRPAAHLKGQILGQLWPEGAPATAPAGSSAALPKAGMPWWRAAARSWWGVILQGAVPAIAAVLASVGTAVYYTQKEDARRIETPGVAAPAVGEKGVQAPSGAAGGEDVSRSTPGAAPADHGTAGIETREPEPLHVPKGAVRDGRSAGQGRAAAGTSGAVRTSPRIAGGAENVRSQANGVNGERANRLGEPKEMAPRDGSPSKDNVGGQLGLARNDAATPSETLPKVESTRLRPATSPDDVIAPVAEEPERLAALVAPTLPTTGAAEEEIDLPLTKRLVVGTKVYSNLLSSVETDAAQRHADLNNMTIGIYAELGERHRVGFEIGQEAFPQVFRVREDNAMVRYEQNPVLIWYGAAYQIRGNELGIGGLRPYAQATAAVTEIVGGLGRGAVGLEFKPDRSVALSAGLDGSAFFYRVDEQFFSTTKLGMTCGVSIIFGASDNR